MRKIESTGVRAASAGWTWTENRRTNGRGPALKRARAGAVPLLFALACVAGCDAPSAAPEPVGKTVSAVTSVTISGTVTSSGGAPLAGASVTLNGSAQKVTTSDAAGKYAFTGLAAGSGQSYSLSASKAGCTFSSPQNLNGVETDQVANFET